MASAVAGPEADSPASLADEVERVREAFTRLSGGSARGLVDASSRLQLEDERARFRVWAENIGAHHGPNDKRSLEHRLRHTPELLVSIAELLRELHGVLEEIENAAPEPRVDARGVEDEPSDTTTASQTELEELCLIVGDIITSLLRSSTLMRTATVRDRYARAAIAGKDYPFDPELDIRHVKDLYPKIAARPWLATRLGTAITRRRQFLRYSLEHRDRLAAEETAQPGTVEASGASQMLWSGQRPQTEASIKLDPPDLTLRHRATIAGTAATTVQAGAALGVDVRNLHLSTEDDLISESTSFVSSISASSDKIRVARLDSLSKAGSPFECPYCRGIVQFRNQTAWKRHVFQDLRAYVCTFRDCTAGLFQDRDAWFDHESSVHRRIWTCLSCEEKSFETADRLSNHFTTTHPSDLGAGDWALAAMVAASSRAMDRMPAISCPLCDDLAIQPDSQAERRDGKASSAAELTVPVGLFRRHLAGHLEQLALSAIPISFDDSKLSDSDSHTSDGDSDTPSGGSQQLGASLADDALIAHMQSRILQIFRRRYDATPEQVEIEGGCPGPWTLEFAKRVQWKWKPRDASSAVAALEKELWDATGQQEHLQPAAPGVPAEDRTYRISKEDLLLDGASWRELNGLIGLSSVKSIITAFAKEILFGQQSEVARTNTLFFLGPPGTGRFEQKDKAACRLLTR